MAMAGGKRTRNGLDNGVVKETKRQKKERRAKELAVASAAAAADAGVEGADLQALEDAAAADTEAAAAAAAAAKLTIRPGEKLADFNRRVDAALPLAGIVKNALPNSGGSKDPLGLAKTFRTKQERKLHKLYAQWREDDKKIKEREQDEKELMDEQDAELDEEFGAKWRVDFQQPAAKRSKKNKGGGSNNYGDDDIWGSFNRKHAKASKPDAVRAGVHNSVEAPPERLTQIDTSKFTFAKKQKDKARRALGQQ